MGEGGNLKNKGVFVGLKKPFPAEEPRGFAFDTT